MQRGENAADYHPLCSMHSFNVTAFTSLTVTALISLLRTEIWVFSFEDKH